MLRAITTLPFVISTEAKRSGEISVWILFLGEALAVYRFASKKELSSDVVSISHLVRG
jgi:hypothetical protein